MLRNYLVAAYRNLLRHKVFSFINIFGLALGMAACFFVFYYVYFESNYDSFNEKSDRLYRVVRGESGTGDDMSAVNATGIAPAMKEDFSEVENFTRLVNISILLNTRELSYEPENGDIKVFHENKLFVADPNFFQLFSYRLTRGDVNKCLADASSIVISQSVAEKYFGKGDPMGKTMKLNGVGVFAVSGVFEDVPDNSHIKFDILVSFNHLGPRWGYNEFDWPEFYNYVLLKPGADPEALEKKFPAFIKKHMQKEIQTYSIRWAVYLQKVRDIHLTSNYSKEAEVNGSKTEIGFLAMIGVFIMIIAWINYVNLSTSRSLQRSKEVGLRKVVGASVQQVFGQFLLEALIVNVLALVFGICIILAGWPFFEQLTGKNINADFFQTGLGSLPIFWISVFLVLGLGTLVTGTYPALVLSSFTPVSLFKGLIKRPGASIYLRKGLVTLQFVLSILLIAATIIVYSQLKYSRQQELGYNKENLLVVKAPALPFQKVAQFNYLKTTLNKLPVVESVSSSSDIPGEPIRYQNSTRHIYQDRKKGYSSNLIEVDDNFQPTYQFHLAAGRNFLPTDTSRTRKGEVMNIIINEDLASDLGFPSAAAAVNRQIICILGVDDLVCNIVGVIKNYHHRSLKEKFEPTLFYFPVASEWKYLSFRLRETDTRQALGSIEGVYKEMFPGSPFEYFFIDEHFNRQYAPDERLGNVFLLFSLLAIVVACFGLWGLSGFNLQLRLKEIGIRKALGASVQNLILLLTREYVQMACFAAVITAPIIYYVSHRWLENFAFHFQPGVFVFLLPGALLLFISLATVIFQTLRSAMRSPGVVLRNQ